MKDAHDSSAPAPAPRRRGRPPVGDQPLTPAQRKAAQRERERKAFVTYARAELEAIGTDSLLDELGRLVTAGRPALAGAIWAVLQARAEAARAVMHPEQELIASQAEQRMAAARVKP